MGGILGGGKRGEAWLSNAQTLSVLSAILHIQVPVQSRLHIQKSVQDISEQLGEFPLNEYTCVTSSWKALTEGPNLSSFLGILLCWEPLNWITSQVLPSQDLSLCIFS